MNESQAQKIIELLESLIEMNESKRRRNTRPEIKSYDAETLRMRNSLLFVSVLKFVLVFLGAENLRFISVEFTSTQSDTFAKIIFILTVIIVYKMVFYFIVVSENRFRKTRDRFEYESRGYDFYILLFPLIVGLICSGLAWEQVQDGWSWVWHTDYWAAKPCFFGMLCNGTS